MSLMEVSVKVSRYESGSVCGPFLGRLGLLSVLLLAFTNFAFASWEALVTVAWTEDNSKLLVPSVHRYWMTTLQKNGKMFPSQYVHARIGPFFITQARTQSGQSFPTLITSDQGANHVALQCEAEGAFVLFPPRHANSSIARVTLPQLQMTCDGREVGFSQSHGRLTIDTQTRPWQVTK